MVIYRCDNCARESGAVVVKLKGVTGTSGGITLPEYLCEKDFCSTECFWEWSEKYKPDGQ